MYFERALKLHCAVPAKENGKQTVHKVDSSLFVVFDRVQKFSILHVLCGLVVMLIVTSNK